MRLWSIHPQYLDQKGLVALWREGLLAQNVIAGKTKGYRHHPQLHRFLKTRDPLGQIGYYLAEVAREADRRGYNFNSKKILKLLKRKGPSAVTRGQLKCEFKHLLRKLKVRDLERFEKLRELKRIRTHASFFPVVGGVEPWERNIS